MPSKLSGGKRAGNKRRAVRAAADAQRAGSAEFWREQHQKLGPPPIGQPESAHQWLADVGLLAVAEAAASTVPLPNPRLDQIGRLIAAAAKVLDPAKLSAKLAAYERAIEELDDHATPVGSGEDRSSRPTPSLS